MTYGGGIVGFQFCSFTVNECTTPRPLTASVAMSRDRQVGQIGDGGWIQ